MNLINSLIIEGQVDEIQKTETETQMVIKHERFFKDENENTASHISRFTVLLPGALDKFAEKLQKDDKIRIVGILQEYSSKVVIFCEHLEVLKRTEKEKKANEE